MRAEHEVTKKQDLEEAISNLLVDDINEKKIVKINDQEIKIKEQVYHIVEDYREAFDLDAFRSRYQEFFEKFDFIVGDWGFEQLRLKGFYQLNQPKVPRDQLISFLDDYLKEYCNFGCQYFILAKENSIATFGKLKEKRIVEKVMGSNDSKKEGQVSTRKPNFSNKRKKSNRKNGSEKEIKNIVDKEKEFSKAVKEKKSLNKEKTVKPVIKKKPAIIKQPQKVETEVKSKQGSFVIKKKADK